MSRSLHAKSPLRGLLIDLDGTLYHGSRMIDGADRLIRYLRGRGLPYLFVTNNSSATPETVAERLNEMGIPAVPQEVCTSAQAAARYAARRKPGGGAYVVGESGLCRALEEAGLRLAEPDGEMPDFVIQGIDRFMTYEKLAHAVRFIRAGAEFVLTNPDVLLPSEGGLMPGAGSIGALLQTASGVKPTVIGKPSAILMSYALERLALGASETWVVGDNPATDIAAAAAAGCPSALVLTGLARRDSFRQLLEKANCEADEIFDDLHTLLAYIKDKMELHA
ncbi:TIGR01457 family HAD-type hydrolase [Paenibacillus humicola]|uniref:TIGR01457 family HAD-type hydrolase n=1 Tax=Paenibacillus humicola TaxID=3110540 RepID=UPI00237A4328|nr:TIGR01457 family HAD-type hydrolase [Paenibacillus humicola]